MSLLYRSKLVNTEKGRSVKVSLRVLRLNEKVGGQRDGEYPGEIEPGNATPNTGKQSYTRKKQLA